MSEHNRAATELALRLDEVRAELDLSALTLWFQIFYQQARVDSSNMHLLFYHIVHGMNHSFNKLDLQVDKFNTLLDKEEEIGRSGASSTRKGINGNSNQDLEAVVKVLTDQVEGLVKKVNKLEAPDHGCVLKFGGLTFTCLDNIQIWLEELNEEEPQPVLFWGHAHDLWHFCGRLQEVDATQQLEGQVAEEQYKMIRLKITPSQVRIAAGMSCFAPLLFDPVGTAKSTDCQ